jgi:GH24 family phage-related lysozyme (muramidase)
MNEGGMSEQSLSAEHLGFSKQELEQIEAVLAYREREEVAAQEEGAGAVAMATGAGTPTPEAIIAAGRVSDRSFKLIVEHETGGKAYYERIMRSRAVWPKAASGITIGFGYDLGYVGAREYHRDWAELIADLSETDRKALEACVGRHSGRDSAATMQSLLASVKGIVIPWSMAEAVFRAKTLPKFALMTENALPNQQLLNGDCFGALVSLTFNRGASYSKAHDPARDPLDRYREMRAIKAAMNARRFEDIPAHMRSMIRIWVGTAVENGLRRRRVDEATLFETGLSTMQPHAAPLVAESVPGVEKVVSAAAIPADQDSVSVPGDDDAWVEVTEDDLAEAALSGTIGFAAGGATWGDDDDQPDYAHLGPQLPRGVAFTLKADDLALIAQLNAFDLSTPENTPVLFGLRGAGIVKDHTNPQGIVLVDQRPDHIAAKCVIGVWDRAADRVSVFPGSTVPNQAAVLRYKTTRAAGNLLPTGLYGYVCGPHTTKNRSTPGCFLLRTPDMTHRVVVVRRSVDDLIYQRRDMVHRCGPGDNIHPTFFGQPTAFSSLGCQTVVGSFRNGAHAGPWARFRAAAGFTDADGAPGKRFVYILVTGAEARIASALRTDGLAADGIARRRLRRLRAGSSGKAVVALQQRLNLPNPDGQLGPFTAESLHGFQKALPGSRGSDGIFSPQLDETLGWQIFTTVEA